MTDPILLSIKDLSVDFRTSDGTFSAVKKVSFDIRKGQTTALVGESGSGKSVTALSVMQLLPYPRAQHPAGSSITFDGQQLVNVLGDKIEEARRTIGDIEAHGDASRGQA